MYVVSVTYINTIIYSFSYEAWPSLGHTTANHNSGVGTAKALSCSVVAVRDIRIASSSVLSCFTV
jgi:hypothetical protein